MGRRRDIDGRQLILSAALKLFAEYGVEGVSIRAVNREAGLGPASVHYHFGTKDALVDAVLQMHGNTVLSAVIAGAEGITTAAEPVTPRELVTRLVEPYLQLIYSAQTDGQAWVRVVSQLLQTDPDRILDRRSLKPIMNATSRVYPDAAPSDVRRAMRMCFSLLLSQLATMHHAASRRSSLTVDVEMLVDFISGGLDATLRAASPSAAAVQPRGA